MDPSLVERMKVIRRDIHAHPELGFEEYRTQALVRDTLLSAGVDAAAIKVCAKTGLVVDITGSGIAQEGSGPRILAIRADMDGLPVTETSGASYASTIPGKAHSCGHDGHVASALGAALLLHARKERLPSNCTVRFLFQPAEEGPGGAVVMIREGAMEGVSDGVFGYHNTNLLPLGSVWVQPSVASAHCCDLRVTVTGKGGHASMPHLCRDPLLAAAHMVVGLNNIVSRSISGHSSGVLSICCLQAGNTTNVIPDFAVLKGTIRDFSAPVGETLLRRAKEVLAGTAAAFGVDAAVDVHDSYPCIINADEPTAFVTKVCLALFGKEAVLEDVAPMPGAEDFSYFGQEAPGCFFQLGGGTPDCPCPNCHQANYDYNDDITPIAMGLWVRLVEARFLAPLYPEAAFFPELPTVEKPSLDKFVAAMRG